MVVKTKIYSPGAKSNKRSGHYKISAWIDGIYVDVQFTKTKKQALKQERRFKREFKNKKWYEVK